MSSGWDELLEDRGASWTAVMKKGMMGMREMSNKFSLEGFILFHGINPPCHTSEVI